MYLSFDALPKREKAHMIDAFGLSETESRILTLRYVNGFSYQRIAAEMCVSVKSVGNMLTRSRRHMVDIAKTLYPIADERTRHLIDVLGWVDLDFPTISSRNEKRKAP